MQIDTVLLTRPIEASRAFAQAVRLAVPRDVRILISPLIVIDYYPIAHEVVRDAVPVFTSAHGVASWAQSNLLVHGKAICVGPATTARAAELGFDAYDAGGTVEHVLAHIVQHLPYGPIVHVHGVHTRGNLTVRLGEQGILARSVVAYDQKLCDLTEEARTALDGKERIIVPLFSPRSAVQFAKTCPKAAQTTIIAMSGAVAQHVQADIIVDRPDGPSMVAAVAACLS